MRLTPAHSSALIKATITPAYWSFNKSQLVIVLAVSDPVDVIPEAPWGGRELAFFAGILFTLIARIRDLFYVVRRSGEILCSGSSQLPAERPPVPL